MTARVLDGRTVAARLREDAAARVAALVGATGRAPRLAIIRPGADGPAALYAESVARAARRAGIDPLVLAPVPVTTEAIVMQIEALNHDTGVAGIVVAQPLPPGVASTVIDAIDPRKDIDGATAVNAGRLARGEAAIAPATARAVMTLLAAYGIDVAGRRAVVVGRSQVIGRPVAALLVAADATVTVCHRATRDLAEEVRRAEILVVAAGTPGLIGPEMVSPSAIVVDCGISTVDGRVVGDVAPSVSEVAAGMAPVPGGVGPVTAAVLVLQAVEAAERLAALPGGAPS